MVLVGSLVMFPLSVLANNFMTFDSLEAMLMKAFWNGDFVVNKTNWLGLICIFNVVVSATGFFLFKDK